MVLKYLSHILNDGFKLPKPKYLGILSANREFQYPFQYSTSQHLISQYTTWTNQLHRQWCMDQSATETVVYGPIRYRDSGVWTNQLQRQWCMDQSATETVVYGPISYRDSGVWISVKCIHTYIDIYQSFGVYNCTRNPCS